MIHCVRGVSLKLSEMDSPMGDVKLVAVDLDGTLLRDDKSLDEAGVHALIAAAKQGVAVIIATSRQRKSAVAYRQAIPIAQAPLICSSGAIVMEHHQGEIWQKETIPLEIARMLAVQADARGWQFSILVDEIDHVFLLESGEHASSVRVIERNTAAINGKAPIRFYTEHNATVNELGAWYQQAGIAPTVRLEPIYDKAGLLESYALFSANATKGHALVSVAQRLNIPVEATLSIGDNVNDITMLQMAGVGVAMGNAVPDVKQHADVIAPTNEEHGVAWALEQFVLK